MRKIKLKSGKDYTVLNPKERKDKYKLELETGKKFTNNLKPKLGKNGRQLKLQKSEEGFRTGYISAYIDSAKTYFSRQKKQQEHVSWNKGKSEAKSRDKPVNIEGDKLKNNKRYDIPSFSEIVEKYNKGKGILNGK